MFDFDELDESEVPDVAASPSMPSEPSSRSRPNTGTSAASSKVADQKKSMDNSAQAFIAPGDTCTNPAQVIMRAGKDLNSEKVAAVPPSTLMHVEAVDGRRARVTTPEGVSGWISLRGTNGADLVKKSDPTPARPTANGYAQKSAPQPAKENRPINRGGMPASKPSKAPEPKQSGVDRTSDGLQRRVAELKERFPGANVEVPSEAISWTQSELETFFESNGFLRPKARQSAKPSAEPVKLPDQEPVTRGSWVLSKVLQMQDQLHSACGSPDVKKSLKQLDARYPRRKEKGSPQVAEYFEEFEALVLSLYAPVLTRWGFPGTWEGVQQMAHDIAPFMYHREVKRHVEEINVLLGLPRDAKFQPAKKKEQAILDTPGGEGAIDLQTYGVPDMIFDDDGDGAHEFWEEGTGGALKRVASVLEAEFDTWSVVHKPFITIRSKPDPKAKPLGSRRFGDRVLGTACGKWVKLHDRELRKLRSSEAWVLIDGAEVGLGPLVEQVSARAA